MAFIGKSEGLIFRNRVFADGRSGEVAESGADRVHIRQGDKGIPEAATLCLGIDELAVLQPGTVEVGGIQLGIIHHAVYKFCTREYRTAQIAAGEVDTFEQAAGKVSLFAPGSVEPECMEGTDHIDLLLIQDMVGGVVFAYCVIRGDRYTYLIVAEVYSSDLRTFTEHLAQESKTDRFSSSGGIHRIPMEVEFAIELAGLDLIDQFIRDADHPVDEVSQHRIIFYAAEA